MKLVKKEQLMQSEILKKRLASRNKTLGFNRSQSMLNESLLLVFSGKRKNESSPKEGVVEEEVDEHDKEVNKEYFQ